MTFYTFDFDKTKKKFKATIELKTLNSKGYYVIQKRYYSINLKNVLNL